MQSTIARTPARNIASAAVFGLATAGAAWLASLATSGVSDSEWFRDLEKPVFYPPDATFSIVWTILYIGVAVAGWLAWRSGGGATTTIPWVIQLVLNLFWSVLFFGLQEPVWALAEIVLLALAVTWAAVVFWRYNRWATYIFLPYLAWIVFAALLNASIVALN